MKGDGPGEVIGSDILVRPYRSDDAAATLSVFVDAATTTAAADYSAVQIAAWAGAAGDNVVDWDARMRSRDSLVATVDEQVVGFSDVDSTGYIDMMYVAPRFGRQQVGSRLLAAVTQRAREHGTKELVAHVSITARRFFEAHGFHVQAQRSPVVDGVAMTNYRMVRALGEG